MVSLSWIRLMGIAVAFALVAKLGEHAASAQSGGGHGGEHAESDNRQVQDEEGDASTVVKLYRAELEKLRDYVAGSIDPCRNAIYVAARNSEVASIIIRNLADPDLVFHGVHCLGTDTASRQLQVLFDFNCKSGVFCLVDPNVLVVVDVKKGRVVDIVNPHSSDAPIDSNEHETFHTRAKSEADRNIVITTRGLKFIINNAENPPIRASLGETVKVSLSSAGNHDWTLVYKVNGREVVWQMVGPNGTATFTADRVGEFDYFCSVSDHREEGMKGKFIVE